MTVAALFGGAAWPAAAAGAAALAPGAALARVAPRLRWLDAPRGGDAARKLQERPVPPVGGAALLVGLGVAFALGAPPWGSSSEAAQHALPLRMASGAWPLVAIALAFLVGLVDDLLPGGLRPRRKLLGQAACGLALAAPAAETLGPVGALAQLAGWALAACIAANLVNTFDNADGAATGLGAFALCAAGAPAGAAALGFLPLNLARPRGGGAPFAYLGDAGSHALALTILATPAAWPGLLLPALDLARLCVVRLRAGRRPWQGDRRHLAHRLQARGLGPPAVLGALLAIAAPALLFPGAAGGLSTAALFALAVAATPDPAADAPDPDGTGVRGQ